MILTTAHRVLSCLQLSDDSWSNKLGVYGSDDSSRISLSDMDDETRECVEARGGIRPRFIFTMDQ